MTVIEYFGIDSMFIQTLLIKFNQFGLPLRLIENNYNLLYGNPMPYIKIVNLGEEYINYPNSLPIIVIECRDENEFSQLNNDLNILETISHAFVDAIVIPVYGKELDIKVIAKNDAAIDILAYKRLGQDALSYRDDPSKTIKIITYKLPSQLILL